MEYIVVAYYTDDKIYTKHVMNLTESLKKFNLNYYIEKINGYGNWQKNTHYKPDFIKKMLIKYFPAPILYVDADAVFCRYPLLFENIQDNIAVFELDHTLFRRRKRPPEIISSVIYMKNNKNVYNIVDKWIVECENNPDVWDQKCLQKVLGNNFYHLPPQYCCIFDYMSSVKDPVIKQFQASREARRIERARKIR